MEGEGSNQYHFHPLLAKTIQERRSYTHGFSSAQIQVVAAACDALLPSSISTSTDASLQSFYQSSAAQPPLPDEVINNIFIYIYIFLFFFFSSSIN